MATIKRSRVYFDIVIGRQKSRRVTFELFNDIVPRTAENFRALCTGEKGIGINKIPLHFKGSSFHRIIESFVIQGGDSISGDGSSGESIYGPIFASENFVLQHDTPFLLSMVRTGRNANASQFFITLAAAPHLDGTHVVFGQLSSGHEPFGISLRLAQA